MTRPEAWGNKRYYSLSCYLKEKGLNVQKAVVNTGCSCPNADGSKGLGGCFFCDGSASYFSKSSALSVTEQLRLEKARIESKKLEAGLIAYFQSGTNTYMPAHKLKALCMEALAFPGVVGLSLATRPDCIAEDVMELLKELNGMTRLTVELGLQTVKDKTAEAMNRCYPFSVFRECFFRLKTLGIRCCVHIINGLPGEDREDMLQTATVLGAMKPDGIKIQLLHVLSGTGLAQLYEGGGYTPMELMNYVETTAMQLERLPISTVIERLTGDGDRERLLAPLWSRDKLRVLGSIDRILTNCDSFQGRLAQ